MTPALAVGVDIGGTNLKTALVDQAGHILAQQSIPTDPARGPASVVADIVESGNSLLGSQSRTWNDVAGVGAASPGPLDLRAGRIIKAANLPGWCDVPLRDMIASATGCPVILENDANAAAFGEYWHRGLHTSASVDNHSSLVSQGSLFYHAHHDLVFLTLGTGVGAGVILGGRILHGAMDNAAELGHMIVVVDGLSCPCGQRGCLEQYASATAVARQAAEAIQNGESSILASAAGPGKAIDAALVAGAAQAGDPLAVRVWDQACLFLAIAIINIQHAYNPGTVLLGGGMSAAGEFLLTRVRHYLGQHKWSLCADLPEVRRAELGNDAGVIGSAGLVWNSLERK